MIILGRIEAGHVLPRPTEMGEVVLLLPVQPLQDAPAMVVLRQVDQP